MLTMRSAADDVRMTCTCADDVQVWTTCADDVHVWTTCTCRRHIEQLCIKPTGLLVAPYSLLYIYIICPGSTFISLFFLRMKESVVKHRNKLKPLLFLQSRSFIIDFCTGVGSEAISVELLIVFDETFAENPSLLP